VNGHQCRPQSKLQDELLLGPRRGLGEHGQQRQTLGQMLDRFRVGRALTGLLSGPLPVCHGWHREAGFRVMMAQQFRLGLGRLWKSLL
jgi:hypothetical protein